jgi:hypothetical protein
MATLIACNPSDDNATQTSAPGTTDSSGTSGSPDTSGATVTTNSEEQPGATTAADQVNANLLQEGEKYCARIQTVVV